MRRRILLNSTREFTPEVLRSRKLAALPIAGRSHDSQDE